MLQLIPEAMEQKKEQFVFKGYDADLAKGLAYFYFEAAIQNKTRNFKETIYFPAFKNHSAIHPLLVKTIFNNILLILGISYWKLFCPANIKILPFELSKDQANFWNIIYTKGLGEFFYKNKIDFRGLLQFPYSGAYVAKPIKNRRKNRSLLMLGGGKDSIVVAELFKKNQKQFHAFSVNSYPLQKRISKLLKTDLLVIRRKLDPKLFALNRRENALNGHIPVSAIYAFLGLLAAVLYDYKYVVASNEKSANFGNVKYLGEEINHQWSKSQEFERMFQNYVKRYVTPDIFYYSPLRRFSELQIVKKFSQYPQYFPYFSSCNSNFRILKSGHNKKWCCKCSKCAFVFAALAAYIPKKEVIKIFGKNLLADEKLIPLYKELLGIKGIKPFECVGTPQETKFAFSLIAKRGEFNKDSVVRCIKISST